MEDFTITELYEISDALMERRARLICRRKDLAEKGIESSAAERMIEDARSAHLKIEAAIINRVFKGQA
jgi:hypothetical protein